MAVKSDSVIKLVFVLFVAVLSFSVGTFVGKNYSDNQHNLAKLEPQKTDREVASVPSHGESSTSGHEGENISDDELEKMANELMPDEAPTLKEEGDEHASANHHGTDVKAVAAKPSAPGHTAPKVADTHGSDHSDAQAAKDQKMEVSLKKAKAQTNADEKSKAEMNAPIKSGAKFTVQIAAYSDEAEAQKMASDLKAKGYPTAFYVTAEVKGKTWHRVSVGQFATMKEAMSYRNEVMDKGDVGSAIVQKITANN